jgi:hypothetical protein
LKKFEFEQRFILCFFLCQGIENWLLLQIDLPVKSLSDRDLSGMTCDFFLWEKSVLIKLELRTFGRIA